MSVAVVTGAGGLVGSSACRKYAREFDVVVGVDNDSRAAFFGAEASTGWAVSRLVAECPNFVHVDADIRDQEAIGKVFAEYGSDVGLIVHAAAQPSHDWAAKEPLTDFGVNAVGTMVMLEATRRWSPEAVFIFTSTNKVYGDRPNFLPLVERDTRWEVDPSHPASEHGIDESMSIDTTKHSLFGVSKAAADLMVQEYGRYFGMKTTALRAGCLTGPAHSGTELHGFLAYLMKCAATGQPYRIFGYEGKQVRDNLHSDDLVRAFSEIYRDPRCGEVYNIGGGRVSDCSMLEAIDLCERIADRRLIWSYEPTARSGDHIWWVSDTRKFQSHYPGWTLDRSVEDILRQLYAEGMERWES